MMSSQKSLLLFLVFVAFLSLSHANKNFYVGGKDGWVLQPKEKYNDWAGRQRFQVNDTLIFKYEKGSDSVLLVHKVDYYKCHRKNPVKKMESGNSEFQFPHSGPFYFISGKEGHCEKGQKLITVVIAPRNKTPSTKPPAISPYPSSEPAPSPKHHVPVVQPPKSSSPGPAYSPKHHGPVVEPPKASSPGPVLAPSSPSPVAEPPKASSPGPALAPLSPSPVSESPKEPSPTPAPSSSHVSPYPGPAHSPNHPGPVAHPPKAASPSPAFPPSSPTPSSFSPSPLSGSPQASTPPNSGPVGAPTPGSGVSPPAPPVSPPEGSPPPSVSQAPSGRQTGTPGQASPAPTPAPSVVKSSATATYSSAMVLAGSFLLSMVFGSRVGGF